MTQFLQTLVDGLTVGSLYALIALGYTMVYGILKFINFAHSDVFALGVQLSISFALLLGVSHLPMGAAPPWYVGVAVLILAMLSSGLAGFLIERFAYRPLRNAPRLNVLITAIGVSLLLQNVGQLPFVFGPYPRATPQLLPDTVLAEFAGVQFRIVDAAVIGTAVLLMIALQYLIYKTKLGMAMRAVSFNTRIAGLMGINVNFIISFTFVVGSMLAAAAGFLYALKYQGQAKQTADAMWVMLGLKAFVAAVVGGIGNVRGAVLGGLLIGLIEFFGVQYVSSHYRDAYVFAILILVLLLRPEVILCTATVEKVLMASRQHGTDLEVRTQRLRPTMGSSAARAIWPLGAAIIIGLLIDRIIGPMVGGFAANVMVVIGINIILAVSLNVVNGFTGQFSIGHAGFMALGGYVTAMLVYYGSIKLWGSADFAGGALSYTGAEAFNGPLIGKGDVLFIAACLIGGLFAAGAGYIVGLPSLRLRGDYLAIVTLGFGEIVRVLLQGTKDQIPPWQAAKVANVPIWELPLMVGGPKGFNLLPTYATLFWVYLFVVLTLVVVYRLKMSSSGRAFLSIREDEIAAQAMGVDVTKYKVRAFVLSSFMAGVAGGLYAMYIGAISATDLGFQKSIDIIIMVVLGGLGSISGATLSAIILSVLPEVLRDPPPVWPIGLFVIGAMGFFQAWRNDRRLNSVLVVAVITTLLEIVRLVANKAWSIELPRCWPFGLGAMAALATWQAIRSQSGLRAILTVAISTSVVELARRLCLAYNINIADYRLIIYALLLILIMILRPQGLFGVNEIWDYFGANRQRKKSAKLAGATAP